MKPEQVKAAAILVFTPGDKESMPLVIVGVDQMPEPSELLVLGCKRINSGAIKQFRVKLPYRFFEIIRMIEWLALAENRPFGERIIATDEVVQIRMRFSPNIRQWNGVRLGYGLGAFGI